MPRLRRVSAFHSLTWSTGWLPTGGRGCLGARSGRGGGGANVGGGCVAREVGCIKSRLLYLCII